jgi:hypothetical protein
VLALWQVHRAGPQSVQRPGKPAKEFLGVQQPGAGGRQLDGQGQTLQAPAQLHHRPGVALGQGEIGARRAGAVQKQRHRRRAFQLLQWHADRVGWERQRRDRVLPLRPQPQHRPAGRQDRHPGAAGQQLAQVAGRIQHLLQVVQDEQPAVVPQLLHQRLKRRVRPSKVGPHCPADAGQDLLGLGDCRQRHEHDIGIEAVSHALGCGCHQAGLTDPTGPGQGHQPHVGSVEQTRHLADGLLPPDQRGRFHGQRTRTTQGRRRRGRGLRAGGGEPLAQQGRQVVADQPPQLGGRAEPPIRRLLRDPAQQLGQARLAVGRRRLDIQQARQPPSPRQLKLLLQPRDLHARADLAVALPVQPDKDVALCQVGQVQVASGIYGPSSSVQPDQQRGDHHHTYRATR